MSTGGSSSKQSRTDQSGGGNLIGRAPSAPVRKPGKVGGKSMQPDNQSTNRGKGRT